MSSKRHKIPKAKSKKQFSRTADHIHPKNGLQSSGGAFAMRGGLRF